MPATDMPLFDWHNRKIVSDDDNDHRARCVFLVGNGLSRSLLDYFDLNTKIPTWPLIPPPQWVQERRLPLSGSGELSVLWSHDRYPELVELAESLKTESVDRFEILCDEMASELAFNTEGHRLTFCNRHPGIQLRFYLWRLFHLYQQEFTSRCSAPPIDDWPWYPVIRCLLRDTRVTVVSFNYECFLELIISDCGYNTLRD